MTDQNTTQTADPTSTEESGTGLSTADISSAMNPQKNSTEQHESGTTEVETRPTDSGASSTQSQSQDATSAPLFQSDETDTFRSRWQDIQSTFVDDPRHAVEQADNLVADIMKRLADLFANERAQLERQWEQGEDVSTEDLRVALQSYRSFFDRLLSV